MFYKLICCCFFPSAPVGRFVELVIYVYSSVSNVQRTKSRSEREMSTSKIAVHTPLETIHQYLLFSPSSPFFFYLIDRHSVCGERFIFIRIITLIVTENVEIQFNEESLRTPERFLLLAQMMLQRERKKTSTKTAKRLSRMRTFCFDHNEVP